ncbi:MAG: acetyltransferase [Acidobacteriota bacterium]
MPTPLLVVGAGGHAAEVCAYADAIASADGSLDLLGCIDEAKPPGRHGPVVVIGGFDALERLLDTHPTLHCVTAVGDNAARQRLVSRVEALGRGRVVWATVRHPAAVVGALVEVGPGCCLAPGSVVTTRARIGPHTILNVNASVSHDTVVGSFSNLNPGAVVAGNAVLGDGVYVGAGATVIDRVSIGEWTVIGAGAAVVRDLPARVTAVGVPARVIKRR